jgi:hypothetical protein
MNQPNNEELLTEIRALRTAMTGMNVTMDGKKVGEIIASAQPGSRIV